MGATNLEKPAPKTDTTVLGKYWMLNTDDEALRHAMLEIQFELSERDRRRSIPDRNKAATEAFQADIHAEIEAIEAQFEKAPA
jgi:hypothetical protein